MNKYCLLISGTFLIVLLTSAGGQTRPEVKRRLINYQKEKVNFSGDSLDVQTGLLIAPGFSIVKSTCVRCHSPKLITSKRANRAGWLATIRWMQESQGLEDLGKKEPLILDYLAKNYPLRNTGRRQPLPDFNWYKL